MIISKSISFCCISLLILAACDNEKNKTTKVIPKEAVPEGVIKNINGVAPAVYNGGGEIHMVFASGDSIMYCYSYDDGKSFSNPILIGTLPDLAVVGGRGPQIAGNKDQLVIAAAGESGNIYSYSRADSNANWLRGGRLNDVADIAKEGFVSLASNDDGKLFAVWLDLRGNEKNKTVGAASTDGGKTWSANKIIYRSPDQSVCECCKPSVVMKDNHVAIMFRNSLDGKRDMYVIQSTDGGNSFGEAQKLGKGNWPLKGCPMDGGAIVIDNNGNPQTVWRREEKFYVCEPGKDEKEIGGGKNCTMESVNGKNVYAWTEKGEVVCQMSDGIRKNLGKGLLPVIKKINDGQIICVWENDHQIHNAVVAL